MYQLRYFSFINKHHLVFYVNLFTYAILFALILKAFRLDFVLTNYNWN